MTYEYYNPFTSPRTRCSPCDRWTPPTNTGCSFCNNPHFHKQNPCWNNCLWQTNQNYNLWNNPCDWNNNECDCYKDFPSNMPWQNCIPPQKNCGKNNLMWLFSGIIIGRLLDEC